MRLIFYLALAYLLTGCFLNPIDFNQGQPYVSIPSITPAPQTPDPLVTPLPDNLVDALDVMRGICFEAAFDAAGQVFIMRTAEEHINFYGLADNSGLCRRAVVRYPFDFSDGDVLAGLWNTGIGCVARHDVTRYQRDDTNRAIRIEAQFITEGDCNYELVRGFWVGIPNATDYTIDIIVN